MQQLLSLDPLCGEHASEYTAHLVCVRVYICVYLSTESELIHSQEGKQTDSY